MVLKLFTHLFIPRLEQHIHANLRVKIAPIYAYWDLIKLKCGCPHVMKLLDDQLTCTESRLMLLFFSQDKIREVDLGNSYHHIIPPIPPPNAIIPSRINFLVSNQEIFWVGKAGHTFRSASVERITIFTLWTDVIESQAWEWIGCQTLYYSTIDMETPRYSSIVQAS